MPTRPILALLLSALPVMAQEAPTAPNAQAPRGAVAQLVFAHELYAFAQETRDPLSMLVAAKLAGGVELVAVARTPEISGKSAKDQPDAASTPPTPAEMREAARKSADAEEVLGELLAEIDAINAALRPGTARATEASLSAGQSHIWRLPFDGGVLAEIGVIGDGDSNLDLRLDDEDGQPLCLATGPSDRASCDIVPELSGYFTLTVTNLGPGQNGYLLLTN